MPSSRPATSRLTVILPVAVLAGAAACRGSASVAASTNEGPQSGGVVEAVHQTDSEPARRGAAVTLPTGEAFETIARLEYRRTLGGTRLVELLKDEDPAVRARAALALGRMPYPEFGSSVTDPLCLALDDDSDAVRQTVAFALGLRADPGSAGVLAAYRNDANPLVRARIIEAASRLDNSALQAELILFLRDADPRVRMQAAVGSATWDPDAPNADEIDRALLDALNPYVLDPEARREGYVQVDPEMTWRVLYALSRRKADLGRGAFLEYANSDIALARLFAVRGLARIAPDPETTKALAKALSANGESGDWRVAYEAATGLGAHHAEQHVEVLLAATDHANAHVRAAAMAALGEIPSKSEEAVPVLHRGLLDRSSSVKIAALGALVKLRLPADATETLQRFAKDDDPVVRAGAAEAAGKTIGRGALETLAALARDENKRVATAAVEGMAAHLPDSRPMLHALLLSSDNGIRLAAVIALREAPDASDFEPLERTFKGSAGDVSTEVAFNVLENLGELPSKRARALLENAVDDPRPFVRRVAQRVLADKYGVEVQLRTGLPLGPTEDVPLPGKDFRQYETNPVVEVTTSRGKMTFELFPADAPVHVYNFLQLVEKDAYDGLIFHRVVPDFVIQGGDYRGDGNGAAPWRGDALPNEFNTRRFARGALGMPRNDNPDSGGSQFFVTQRPTPHLDGRYTLFGMLRDGGDVLDRIEVGDRILDVSLIRS